MIKGGKCIFIAPEKMKYNHKGKLERERESVCVFVWENEGRNGMQKKKKRQGKG